MQLHFAHHKLRTYVWSDDLLGHQSQSLSDEHLSSAVHRDNVSRVYLRELRNGLTRFSVGPWTNEVEAADHRMNFVDARDVLSSSDRIYDAAMTAGSNDDQSEVFDDKASSEFMLAVIRD